MDNYQAVYDAVRSRMSNADVGSAIESAIRNMNASEYVQMAMYKVADYASEHARPSAVFKPNLFIDGGQWCALYGNNLQDGVAGFGGSPADAMADFDDNWRKQLVRHQRG